MPSSLVSNEANRARAMAARMAIQEAKGELRAGVPLSEVLKRETVKKHMRIDDLLGAVPRIGPAKRDKILRDVEGEVGPYSNRLYTRRVGELTEREIAAVLARLPA